MSRRGLAALAIALPGASLAQSAPFPSRTVTLIVPFPPGGGTDVLGRLFARHAGEQWGVSVVVENRAGASGRIGTELVRRAAPDGHTIVLASTGALMAGASIDHPFSVRDSLAPITLSAAPAYLMVAHPSVGVTDVAGLIAVGKARPGSLAFGSSGVGSASHLSGELFGAMTGVELLHVPFSGTGGALNELLAGRIQLMFAPPQTVMANVASGGLRVLGITSEQPSPLFAGVPAVAATVPGYAAVGWFGLLAPRDTPPAVVNALHAAAARAYTLPDVVERLAQLGATPDPISPDAFATYINADIAKWQRLVRERGIRME
ncbi:Bug family tripartite tricarboxylate transporter substrate binding protein [Humitalea sp. 24SJ18S-53]|uniref:Bug family tripartite tricarboxylate transporter substrate binding protein n=1 Tax=Humitalea sp. 24SJ18S-53 TaxID=3422307 RepID=UPI003D676720